MGNCCCPEGADPNAFRGEGQRLGGGFQENNTNNHNTAVAAARDDEDLPKPLVDKNLTDAERAQQRADRAAAAEARLKQQNPTKPKKKASSSSNEPLRGPNSKPTMTWTV